jgi:hypothetical protein
MVADGPATVFAYEGLKAFLKAVQAHSAVFPLRDWTGQPGVILRHDVDMEVLPAFRMAEVEADAGVRSSLFFLTTAATYNLAAARNRRMLREMAAQGFEIGLHFDPTVYGDVADEDLRPYLEAEARVLEDILGAEVRSVSLHNPSVHGRYPIFEGWRNAYDPSIFGADRYLSDSRMSFRRDPAGFLAGRAGEVSQLLLHPLHYSEDGAVYPDPMARFVERFTDELHEAFLANSSYRGALGEQRLWTLLGQRAREPGA